MSAIYKHLTRINELNERFVISCNVIFLDSNYIDFDRKTVKFSCFAIQKVLDYGK